jgi:hypothetical protein
MTVKLSDRAFDFAKNLIRDRAWVLDDGDEWSGHRPSTQHESAYIEDHGWKDYGLWHLGVDDAAAEKARAHYVFPYGDFRRAHRCGVIAVENRAAQEGHADIEKAAKVLLELIDERS